MSADPQIAEFASSPAAGFGSRVAMWERRSEWPLAILAVLFLGCYAWPILDADIGPGWRQACSVASLVVWALFAVDYCARVVIAHRRLSYVGRRIPDLLILALPMLRPLRLL